MHKKKKKEKKKKKKRASTHTTKIEREKKKREAQTERVTSSKGGIRSIGLYMRFHQSFFALHLSLSLSNLNFCLVMQIISGFMGSF